MMSLDMFGNLEDAKTKDRMVVRIVGYGIGESSGWFHYGGLCAVFPEFISQLKFFTDNMPKKAKESIHLIIDFYTGQSAILLKDKPYWNFTLKDLLSWLDKEFPVSI